MSKLSLELFYSGLNASFKNILTSTFVTSQQKRLNPKVPGVFKSKL